MASRHLYGATRTLLERELPRRGITTTLIDPESREDWEGALTPQTGVLLLEVPANPTLRVFDLRVPAEIARNSEILLAVDGTFASPVNVRFAQLGVGAVIHSATKYLGGHSDLVAGVVSGSQELIGQVQNMMKLYGPAPDPHMAWLLDRGLKTLQMRVAQHNHNAMELARWFLSREGVAHVHYPGLPEHPDHVVASEIMSGFGGMLSIVLDGGGAAADTFTSTPGVGSHGAEPRRCRNARLAATLHVPHPLFRSAEGGHRHSGRLRSDLGRFGRRGGPQGGLWTGPRCAEGGPMRSFGGFEPASSTRARAPSGGSCSNTAGNSSPPRSWTTLR